MSERHNDAGDDASGPDKSCQTLTCPGGQYADSHGCINCSIIPYIVNGQDINSPDVVVEVFVVMII